MLQEKQDGLLLMHAIYLGFALVEEEGVLALSAVLLL